MLRGNGWYVLIISCRTGVVNSIFFNFYRTIFLFLNKKKWAYFFGHIAQKQRKILVMLPIDRRRGSCYHE